MDPLKTLIQLLVKIAAPKNPDGLMHKSHKLTTASSGSGGPHAVCVCARARARVFACDRSVMVSRVCVCVRLMGHLLHFLTKGRKYSFPFFLRPPSGHYFLLNGRLVEGSGARGGALLTGVNYPWNASDPFK